MWPFRVSALSLSFLLGISLCAAADVLVFKDGSRNEVRSLEIKDRAVHFVTTNGKRMSVIRDVIDVPATLEANRPEKSSEDLSKEEASAFVQAPWKPTRVTEAPQPTREKKPPTATVETRREDPEVVEVPVQRPAPSRPPPAPAKTSAPPRTVAVDSSRPDHRFAFFVNGALGTSPLDFTDTRRFELFLEGAIFDQRYRSPESLGIEVGAFVRIKGPIGFGASVELLRNDNEAAYSAVLPHPFYFERNRELSGRLAGLVHEEQALHLNAVLSKTWARRFTVDFFGGPSLFLTKTEVLADVPYTETYPYDTVVPGNVETRLLKDDPIGYNIGAGATLRIAGPLGLDFGLRYSKGQIRIAPSENRTIEFLAGGLRFGAGLRFLFR